MIPNDFLYGSFEFAIDVHQDDDENWTASAQGFNAKHQSRDQAINDLNRQLNDAMERGELVPSM